MFPLLLLRLDYTQPIQGLYLKRLVNEGPQIPGPRRQSVFGRYRSFFDLIKRFLALFSFYVHTVLSLSTSFLTNFING